MSDEEGGSEAEQEASGEEETPQSEEAETTEITEEEKDVAYSSYQLFVFFSCFVGHCLFCYNRRVFQFVLPHVMNEGVFSGYQITLIMVMQQFGFTLSSFFVGVSMDTGSPKAIFAIGMFMSGFFNFGFSDVDEPTNLMLLSLMNGLSNGCSWPCVVRIVRMWFPSTSFGLWWSLFNLSFFATNMIGPGVANSWATEHGWQVAIQMPAVISMVVAFPLYFTNFDKPSDVGYEDQEIRGEETDAHWSDMLGCEFMLVLCGGGFLLQLIRTSSADWGQLYLMEERGISTYNAGHFGTSLEFGGFMGTVLIGAIADMAKKKKLSIGYYRFPRMILLFLSLFGGGAILSAFILAVDAYSSSMEVNFYGFVMGVTFCSALQNIETMLIETSPPNKFSSCYALLNFSCQLAGIMAGFPISLLAAAYGWTRAFLFLNFSLLVAFFALTIGKDLDQTFIPPPPKKKQK